MLTAQTNDNDCVGNVCSDIEAQLMRQGGRQPVPEQLIVRDNIHNIAEWRKRVILLQEVDVHQWQLLMNWQVSARH